jgi:hypothetical protein
MYPMQARYVGAALTISVLQHRFFLNMPHTMTLFNVHALLGYSGGY